MAAWHAFRMLRVLIIAMALLLTGSTASAESSSDDLWGMDLDELLDMKVGVATKTADRVTDAPSSVTVFTRAEIRNMGITSLEELLNFVPGFHTERTEFLGQEWAISSRGFYGVSDPAILLLIDGLRVNDHFSGSFGLMDRLVPIGMVERVEIIRGPASALYGSNAYFGVVNIVTTRKARELRAEAGQLQSSDVSLNLSHELRGLEVAAFLRSFEDDGEEYSPIYDEFGLTDRTSDGRSGRDAYLTFRKAGFSLNLRRFIREFDDFYLIGTVANDINRLKTEGTGIFATYALGKSTAWQGSVSLGYNAYAAEFFARLQPQGTGPFQSGDLLLGAEHETRVAYAMVDMSSQLGEHHTLSYGATYEYADNPDAHYLANYDVLNWTYLGRVVHQREDEKRLIRDEQRTIGGLYLQERYRPRDWVTAFVGARLDHYNDFGSRLSSRAALVFTHRYGGTVKLMYGEAFQAPNMEKLYLQNNPFEVANPDLEPQEVRTAELSYTHRWEPVQASLTLFHNKETDVFELGMNEEGSFMTVNAGENRSKGAELELTASAGPYLLVRATYGHLFEGERSEAPDTTASLIVNWELGRWNLNLNGHYRSASEVLPEQGGYSLWNVSVRCQLTDEIGVFGTGRNILDEDYQTHWRTGSGYLPNRGRLATLGLSYTF